MIINNKSDLIQAADELWDEGKFLKGIDLLMRNWRHTLQMTPAEELETQTYAVYFRTQIDVSDYANGEQRFGEKAITRQLEQIAREAVGHGKGLTAQGREWFKSTAEFLHEEYDLPLRPNPEDWGY